MMNNLSASWLSVIHEKLTWVRLYTLFLTALSTEIFRIVQKDLSLCSFRIWAQRWKLEAKRPSGSRDMADLWFGKKKLVGGDSNPGRGVFSTYLMNAWCNSDKWHIRRCTILFHIERTGSGQNLESGSCVNRVRLIAVLWSPRGTHGRNLYAMLIERGQHAQLPTGQNRTEIGSVRAEKPQSPVSGHLEHVDCDFERIPLLAYGMNLRCLFIIV